METTTTPFINHFRKSITPDALRTYIAEYISTFLYVFSAVGATMSSSYLMPYSTASDPSSLVIIAVANAFGLMFAVYIAANISGGHVNPAVTFGMVVGGHITVPTAIFYWFSQLLGSTMACLVLKYTTVQQVIPTHAIAVEMTGFGAAVIESVLTFGLVYTVYTAGDSRKSSLGAIGPIAIGFVVGANVLAAGPFSGASMNPACSFGSAVVSGNFKNHGVYWVGPLIGALVAGILYENVVFPPRALDSLPGTINQVGV
ncbi:hypothetical protein GIB67_036506 [Kingdonia uniflora]|uniref:Uncharacterized protein n=1 Tax=Kingdonia uniflora TaxID=39325 RepID=A0A7J7P7K0_9MAGN|nr:hypothetical protein GIB67_036506 [Kingdonia uniflora]